MRVCILTQHKCTTMSFLFVWFFVLTILSTENKNLITHVGNLKIDKNHSHSEFL